MGSKLKFRLTTLPKVGDTHEDNGFRYEVIEARPHTNKDGAPSMILRWKGQCATCGGDTFTPSGASVYHLARRCAAHNSGWTRAVPFGTAAKEPAKRLGVPREAEKRAPAGEPASDLYFSPGLPAEQRGFHALRLEGDALRGTYGSDRLMSFVWDGQDMACEKADRLQLSSPVLRKTAEEHRQRMMAERDIMD